MFICSFKWWLNLGSPQYWRIRWSNRQRIRAGPIQDHSVPDAFWRPTIRYYHSHSVGDQQVQTTLPYYRVFLFTAAFFLTRI